MQNILNDIKYLVSTRSEPLPIIKKKPLLWQKKFTIKLDDYLKKPNKNLLYNIHSVYSSDGENYITLSKKVDITTFLHLRNLPYTPRGYFHNEKTNVCSCRNYKFNKQCEHTNNYIIKIEELKYYLILIMAEKFDNFQLALFIFYETKNKTLFN